MRTSVSNGIFSSCVAEVCVGGTHTNTHVEAGINSADVCAYMVAMCVGAAGMSPEREFSVSPDPNRAAVHAFHGLIQWPNNTRQRQMAHSAPCAQATCLLAFL